ncbi:MAG: hypothetical protein AAF170_13800, partial [Bacteroidota bacterium]
MGKDDLGMREDGIIRGKEGRGGVGRDFFFLVRNYTGGERETEGEEELRGVQWSECVLGGYAVKMREGRERRMGWGMR